MVLIVGNEPEVVEADLRSGKLVCPHCQGELRPWGWPGCGRPAWSSGWSATSHEGGTAVVATRRLSCSLSVSSPAGLSEATLIGEALFAKATGSGQRTVAAPPAGPAETVRNWFARLGCRAAELSRHFLAWALALDALLHEVAPWGSGFSDAIEAVALAARAASLCFGPKPVWSWASRMTAGGLLANTTWPYPAPP